MEKYGVAGDVRLEGLKKEEALLMNEMARYYTYGTKTAEDQSKFASTQERLDMVRATITETEKGSNLVQED
jgi:hypothetical protein